ncbi:hypothetical protein POY27_27750, partial [Klebsiella pneumoniae]
MLKGDEHNTHAGLTPAFHSPGPGWGTPQKFFADKKGCCVLMNPLMILVKIIKLRWIHILSYDQ